MYKEITEGRAVIKIPEIKKISKKLPVFYNPVMKFNRDISILILNTLNKKNLQICLPLSGTGVRGVRFLLELNKKIIKKIYFNDLNKNFKKIINENLRLNNIKNTNKIKIDNKDANIFLLKNKGFDYIDIDPFGSPNYFLSSACQRISRNGILAVTATDTAALTGTYPKTCLRKYWAVPKRDSNMHETGLRILIRKCQLIGMQYEKALIPVFSFYKDHYFRIFFRCEKNNKKINEIIKNTKKLQSDFLCPRKTKGFSQNHKIIGDIGPLWTGRLFDNKLVNKINKNINKNFENNKINIDNGINKIKLNKIINDNKNTKINKASNINKDNKELIKFLKIIKEESKINTVGFYDIHKLSKKYKFRLIKNEEIIKKIKNRGYKASLTHFSGHGIRSDIKEKELIKLLKP